MPLCLRNNFIINICDATEQVTLETKQCAFLREADKLILAQTFCFAAQVQISAQVIYLWASSGRRKIF